MLRIIVPSNTASHLNFSTFKGLDIPAPVSGVEAEINDDVVLNFENEEEAVIYGAQLENLSNQLSNKSSPEYVAIRDIIAAIKNDEFVLGYIEEN